VSGFDESTFDKALREKSHRRRAARFHRGPEDTEELLPLPEVTRRLRQFEQHYVGIQPIPVARIVGTVDRSRDFDRDFLPRRPEMEDRWRQVERAFPDGAFPVITVFELDGSYFLVDGHHRVAIARQLGTEFIDADITELHTKIPLAPEANIGQIIHAEQEANFLEESGLDRARPGVRISLSRPEGFVELLEIIRVHGYHLMKERGEPVDDADISGDWYDWLYEPAVEAIRQEGLTDRYPNATEGDLFLWLHHRRRAMFPERGGVPYDEVARLVQCAHEEGRVRGRAARAMRKLTRRSPSAASVPEDDDSL
jgi:hypothetical protein